MYRKLNLDRDKVDQCRNLAKRILAPVLRYVSHHSSVAIEQATLKLLSVDPDLVGTLTREQLRLGACSWIPSVTSEKERETLAVRACTALRSLTSDAVKSALGRSDLSQGDPFVSALFEGVNIKRALIDHLFAKRLIARSGCVTTTREDELLRHVDAARQGHQALASLFLNEQLAVAVACPPELMGVPHAFTIDPTIANSALFELAHAQVIRELFPRSPLFFVLRGSVPPWQRHLFHVVGMISEQTVRTTDDDEGALAISKALHDIGDELLINPNGLISRRAHTLVENTFKFLQRIERKGLLVACAEGVIAGVECSAEGGQGIEGIFQRERRYYNPLLQELEREKTEEIMVEVSETEEAPSLQAGTTSIAPEAIPRPHRRRGRRGGRHRRRSNAGKTTETTPSSSGGT